MTLRGSRTADVRPPPNDRFVDLWTLVHFGAALGLAMWLGPFWALLIVVLWEPLEVLVLMPLAWRWFRLPFGNESPRNVAFDVIADVAGVMVGHFLLA